MRFLATFLILFSFTAQVALAGLPPTTSKGLSDAAASTTFNFQAPYNQFTKTTGTNALVETGSFQVLKNPGFEATTYSTDWTVSGGTLAAAATTNIFYSKGATWDSTAASQTFTSTQVTVPEGFKGQNCSASLYVKTPSGTATHLLQAFDGTNILGSVAVVSSVYFQQNTVTFPCPTSGTFALRLISVAADEPLIAVDEGYLGLARNVGSTQLISEWAAYTPVLTGFGTASTNVAEWRRVGDSIQVRGFFVSGTPTAVTARIGLPSGLNINVSAPALLSQSRRLGSLTRATTANATASTTVGPHSITNDNTALDSVAISINTNSTANQYELVLGNALTISGQSVSYEFDAKITGWTAQTLITADQQRTPTVQVLTSGTTYNTPAGVTYLEVELVGGGGGGGGSGTAAGSAAGSGGTTSFGTSLLSATGGAAGAQQAQPLGGVPTVTSPAIEIVKANGNSTGSGWYVRTGNNDPGGGNGGASPFGGAGAGGSPQSFPAGSAAIANSGSGGGGAGATNVIAAYTGSGGASGGYLKAIIPAPAASYTYSIGGAGTAGGAGATGAAGGAGGTGRIIVREFYGYTTALLANSVSTGTTNGEFIASALVLNSGSACSLSSQSGGFSAPTRNGTGRCSFTLAGFSATPRCGCTVYNTSGTAGTCTRDNAITQSATSAGFQAFSVSTATDLAMDIICIGPR